MSELVQSIVRSVEALWQASVQYLSNVLQLSFSHLERMVGQDLAVCAIILILVVLAHFLLQAFHSPSRR